jgi:hypothetical protein
MKTEEQPALGFTQHPIQWVRQDFSPAVKLPELEADHSHPSCAQVKNAWISVSTPLHVIMAC